MNCQKTRRVCASGNSNPIVGGTHGRDRGEGGIPIHAGRKLTRGACLASDIMDEAMGKRNLSTSDTRHVGSRAVTAMIWLAVTVISTIPIATPAYAHVKWFVVCDSSSDPLPLPTVFTRIFWLFLVLFVTLFGAACQIEETIVGRFLSSLLDRCTDTLHQRTDALLRAAAAVSFALLWADGTVILTPELKRDASWLSTVQVLIPLYLFARATLPAAAAAIFVLYGYGVATYGLFHMLDYPFFLGLAAYFALSASQNARLRFLRVDCLRWTAALSLMWPSMEKFLYPAWIAPILMAHPRLTLGFDVATVITAAGVVEFGLSFALFWTPLVRRLAAAALVVLLVAATFDFGKIDGIGHLMIITILLSVIADPGRKHAGCRPIVAPLVSGLVLLALIFLYSGSHALYYGSPEAAVVPLMGGAALLLASFLCVRSAAVPKNQPLRRVAPLISNPLPVVITDERAKYDGRDGALALPQWLIRPQSDARPAHAVALLANSSINGPPVPLDERSESLSDTTILEFPRCVGSIES
jgi:hypothetical protein